MSDVANGFVTVGVSTAVASALGALGFLAGGDIGPPIFIAAMACGFLYGLETAILTSYDLGSLGGWLALLIDLTWSAPNTFFGFLLGNAVYIVFGKPSRAQSRHSAWVSFQPRSATGFGNNVLQTLGTVNLGGAGQHERMHVLQARIFGPAYLPLFFVFYVATTMVQVLWTISLGAILYAAKARTTAYLRPPSRSAVSGFFGWIYYATPFELWAYASGNP
jgi:hypothetical protein